MAGAHDEGARRKQLGAWYTPPALVAHLTRATVGRRRGPVTVLDPSCGDGRFLAEARRLLGDRATLTGVDVDPAAVAEARSAVPGAEIVLADALTHDWGERRFDVVLGNPPFLNQMARATTRGGKSRFGGGAYADAAAEFLALSTSLLAPGGRLGLVLPQSVLTSRDVGPIRQTVTAAGAIRHVWWSRTRMFDAHVHTCALVVEQGARQRPVSRSFGPRFERREAARLGASWGALLLDDAPTVAATHDGPVLGDLAEFAVDFRDQYYGMVGAVADDADGPPLITCGLIDPGACHWGVRPVRFAKQRFEAPRVAIEKLSPRLQRWAETRLVPKILVSNQTRTIEAVLDREGAWLPGVPVISCTTADLDRVYEVLSAPAATAWVRERAMGSGLSPDTVRLSPSLLASIPLA